MARGHTSVLETVHLDTREHLLRWCRHRRTNIDLAHGGLPSSLRRFAHTIPSIRRRGARPGVPTRASRRLTRRSITRARRGLVDPPASKSKAETRYLANHRQTAECVDWRHAVNRHPTDQLLAAELETSWSLGGLPAAASFRSQNAYPAAAAARKTPVAKYIVE